MRNLLHPNCTFPLDVGIYPLDSANVSTTGAIFFGVICLPTNTWELLRTRLKHVRAFQIELEFESVGFKGEGRTEVPGEKPLSAKEKTNNKPNLHKWSYPRIRTRATLMGGEREIRLWKEQDEGVKNTCGSSRIHFLRLFLLVDELPNESVERNNQIFSNLIQ